MNKLLLIGFFLCNLSISAFSQKLKIKTIEDSLDYVLNTYNYYVRDLKFRRPDIEIMKLPTSIPAINDNSYQDKFFTVDQAKQLYKNDYSSLSTLENSIQQKKKQIDDNLQLKNFQNRLFGPPYQGHVESSKDFQFFFVDPRTLETNSKDVDIYFGTIEKFKRKIRDSLYGIPGDVESLIFSKNYFSISTDKEPIPIFLSFLLNQSLHNSLNCLTDAQLSLVKKAKIFYSNPRKDRTMLWMSSNSDSIFISPFLVRAAFFYALDEYYLFKPLFQDFNKIDWARKNVFGPSSESEFIRFHKPEVQQGLHSFYIDFVDNFSFVFSHELAHTYNDDKWNLLSEIRCDCNGLKSLRSKYQKINLGIYKAIFQAAIDKNLVEAWGVSNIKDLKIRFSYITKFLKENIDCGSIALNLNYFVTADSTLNNQ